MKKIVTFGEVLLRLTTPGNLRFSQSRDYVATFGGSETNVAVSLANFGIPTEFVTRLPDNDIARACVSDLRSHGLRMDGIIYGGDRMGIYFLENGASFRNSKVVYDRAGSSFSTLRPGMIDWEAIFADAGWFHWSGVAAALSQDSADTCLEALQAADRMGLTISCDLNYRKNLWKYGRTAADVMKPLVQYSDVIFGAEPEYKEILGIVPVGFKAVNTDYRLNLEGFEEVGKQVEKLVPRCRKMFLELRNSLSANHNLLAAVLYSNGSLKHTGVYDITHEVDRVGTGDAFVGGLIYGLLTCPDNDQKVLDFALAASCLKNTFYGDFNLATVAEVEALMNGDSSGRYSADFGASIDVCF
ncbi:sugar kinase [Bacteroides sp.]|uniref:sugar kinase n=1 Tax=Bacteroides sp. TaxID=29523 RepID=UPI0025B843FB|nr:sugar kinase [Bacteroides sp.]